VTVTPRLPYLRFALLLLLLGALAVGAQSDRGKGEEKVDLSLEPSDAVGLDELALLRIKIEGGDRQDMRPEFQLENFEIVAGPSQSTSLTIFNGVPSSSLTYSWHLKPKALGKARVYAVKLRSGGRSLDLGERQVDVVENAPARARNSRSQADPFDSFFNDPFFRNRRQREPRPRPVREPPEIFLEAVVEPANPWVGQQVLYSLYLFTQADVRSINPTPPDFKGFWSRDVPQPQQLTPRMVQRDGKRFGKVLLMERALFPRRAGEIEIEPAEAQLLALLSDGNPFSLLPRSQEIQRASNAVRLQVRELPPPPPGFDGLVGQVELEGDLTPTVLEVGDAATLTLTLSGRGHLQGQLEPRLPDLEGIEIFPPQRQSEENLRRKRVEGRRTWSYVLVPEKPGEWQLPPVEFPYFDPQKGRYETVTTEAFELLVKGSTSGLRESGRTVDLHSIRTAALPTVEAGGWRFSAAAPWLLALPWLIVGLLLVRRRSGGGSGNHHRELLRRIAAARQGGEAPRQVAAQIEGAWRDFLEQRWEIPPGTPSTRWVHELEQAGAPQSAAADLTHLADDLHYLRYAPKLSSTQDLEEQLVERSKRLVKALR
jgi:hypothetical protein